jgi:hypothetical protein
METLFCVFLRFRDLSGLELTWDFLDINILPREAPGAQEVNKGVITHTYRGVS